MRHCWETPEHRQRCGACGAGFARLCGIPLIDVDLGDNVAPYAERRAVGNKWPTFDAKCWKPIAEALFGARHNCSNRTAKPFESTSLIFAYLSQAIADRFRSL